MLQLFTVFFYTVNVLGCFHAINCGTLFIYVKNYVGKGRIKKNNSYYQSNVVLHIHIICFFFDLEKKNLIRF